MTKITKFKRLQRLRAMSATEIGYRLHASLRMEFDRVRFHLNSFGAAEERLQQASMNKTLPVKSYLEEFPARRFCLPAGADGRDRLRRLIEQHFPEWKLNAIAEANHLCEHQVELLGYGEVSLGREIDWHRDPVTGKNWPLRFWADYDLVNDFATGDPKTVHELNRHQHLPRLGKAFFLTGDESYAEEALRQISSWIDQNPAESGIHWHSSLEISLRAISWIWTLFFLLPARSLDERSAQRMTSSLFMQLDHVARYLSEFSSPNTHLLGEALSLYMAGVLFQEWEPAARWRDTAGRILEQEIERQFTADGVHAELSSYYHCYALDFYLQALILSIDRQPWPARVWRRVEEMLDVVMHLTRPDGCIPRLGDDDGGRALALRQTHYGSFRDALCTGAVLFGRPQFKHVAGEFCEETLWLLGEKAWWIYSGMNSREPAARSAFWPASGYAIHRSSWTAQANHLLFDHGGVGMARGGHGHADALSVVLSVAGKEMLVDSGAGIYNGSPEWRNYFRSSRAHNTAVVDGCDQSESGETFSWGLATAARPTRQITHAGVEYVEGEHEGYRRLPQGIVHRRGVLFCRPDSWVIVDRFNGEGTHRFELLYHFPEDTQVAFRDPSERPEAGRPETTVLVKSGGTSLGMFFASTASAKAEMISGRCNDIQGWTSSRYGRWVPSPALQLTMEGAAPSIAISVLLPIPTTEGERTSPAGAWPFDLRRLHVARGTAIACAMQSAHHHDLWIAASGEEPTEVLDYEMCGEFFWVRSHADGQKELFAVNASRFACSGRPLLQNAAAPGSVRLRWNGDHALEPFYEGEERPCVESAAS